MEKIIPILSLCLIPLVNANAELCDGFDKPDAWHAGNPAAEQIVEFEPDYCADLKVYKATFVPQKQWYIELRPVSQPIIANSAQDLHWEFYWDILGKYPDMLTQVCLRIIDKSGETFQFQLPMKLKSGQWAHPMIWLTPDKKPDGHWGGDNNAIIDYPVRFGSLVIDGKRNANTKAVYWLANFNAIKK